MSYAEIDDYDVEAEDYAALALEERRLSNPAPVKALAPAPWSPTDPLTTAIWTALPADGRGVEYWRTVRRVAGEQWPMGHVQAAILGLVLVGKAYCEPGAQGCSLVGRGTDPRVGSVGYRTGAVEAMSP